MNRVRVTNQKIERKMDELLVLARCRWLHPCSCIHAVASMHTLQLERIISNT